MKQIILVSTMAVAVGLFAAGLAMGASQQVNSQPQWSSGSQSQGVLLAQKEQGVGTASGQTREVQKEYRHMAHEAAPVSLNKQQVRKMQTLLNNKGYKAGQADGIIGSKTREALRSFQKSQEITVTGKPNEETLRALAPSTQQQEFFGLAPKFGKEGKQQMQKQEPMSTQKEMGVGTASGQTREVQKEYRHMAHEAAPVSLNKQQVRKMQTLLNNKGYKAGQADGIIGSKTREALRSFQKSQEITVTGKPNEETLRALAPSTQQQEFFGLAPKFGKPMKKQQMQKQMPQQKPMSNQQEQEVGPASGEGRY